MHVSWIISADTWSLALIFGAKRSPYSGGHGGALTLSWFEISAILQPETCVFFYLVFFLGFEGGTQGCTASGSTFRGMGPRNSDSA